MMAPAGDVYLDDDTPLRPSDAVAAILMTPENKYLLQLRDNKRGIFYPGHWGFFGGGVDPDDKSAVAGLCRELDEELALRVPAERLMPFTNLTFDYSFCGLRVMYRAFYEVRLSSDEVAGLALGEGAELRDFSARDCLSGLRMAPYDQFAIWMHASQSRLKPRGG